MEPPAAGIDQERQHCTGQDHRPEVEIGIEQQPEARRRGQGPAHAAALAGAEHERKMPEQERDRQGGRDDPEVSHHLRRPSPKRRVAGERGDGQLGPAQADPAEEKPRVEDQIARTPGAPPANRGPSAEPPRRGPRRSPLLPVLAKGPRPRPSPAQGMRQERRRDEQQPRMHHRTILARSMHCVRELPGAVPHGVARPGQVEKSVGVREVRRVARPHPRDGVRQGGQKRTRQRQCRQPQGKSDASASAALDVFHPQRLRLRQSTAGIRSIAAGVDDFAARPGGERTPGLVADAVLDEVDRAVEEAARSHRRRGTSWRRPASDRWDRRWRRSRTSTPSCWACSGGCSRRPEPLVCSM